MRNVVLKLRGTKTAFRKIFNANAYWHESVKPLQYYCSCLPVSIGRRKAVGYVCMRYVQFKCRKIDTKARFGEARK